MKRTISQGPGKKHGSTPEIEGAGVIQATKEKDMFEGAGFSGAVHSSGEKAVTKPLPGKISVVVSNSNLDPCSRKVAARRDYTDTGVDRLRDIADSKPAIQEQLAHMLKSSIFIHSDKLSRFLRFIVEHVIAGNQAYLKEYVIGSEVYDRRPPYHPSMDSIVRTEARRLRGKLKEYYEIEGKHDPVYIYLRPGSYIPAFHHNALLAGNEAVTNAEERSLPVKTEAVTIGILPFRDLASTPLSAGYARGIPDELAYALMRSEGRKVISPSAMAYFNEDEHDVAAAMRRAGVHIAVEGCVKAQGSQLRITARIVDAEGFQLWTKRFDIEGDSQNIFMTEEEIAAALSAGLDDLFVVPNSA